MTDRKPIIVTEPTDLPDTDLPDTDLFALVGTGVKFYLEDPDGYHLVLRCRTRCHHGEYHGRIYPFLPDAREGIEGQIKACPIDPNRCGMRQILDDYGDRLQE